MIEHTIKTTEISIRIIESTIIIADTRNLRLGRHVVCTLF
jgi:hypothetical protein